MQVYSSIYINCRDNSVKPNAPAAQKRIRHTMQYRSEKHYRRSIRLKEYDYAHAGAYFVTICAYNGESLFSKIIDGKMRLNEWGHVVEDCWNEVPRHFKNIELDAFVVMPNHMHGIIIITDSVGARHASPLQIPQNQRRPKPKSLGAILGSFKSAVAKRINKIRATPGTPVWQRNYYEHIIRSDESVNRIREYILANPLTWRLDRENPRREGDDEFDKWFEGQYGRGNSAKSIPLQQHDKKTRIQRRPMLIPKIIGRFERSEQ